MTRGFYAMSLFFSVLCTLSFSWMGRAKMQVCVWLLPQEKMNGKERSVRLFLFVDEMPARRRDVLCQGRYLSRRETSRRRLYRVARPTEKERAPAHHPRLPPTPPYEIQRSSFSLSQFREQKPPPMRWQKKVGKKRPQSCPVKRMTTTTTTRATRAPHGMKAIFFILFFFPCNVQWDYMFDPKEFLSLS
nr:hypothetical protein [Pandoravirus aubagnensis]